MFSIISLGAIIAGAGRVGMSILRFAFDYLLKKQELKLAELKNNSQNNIAQTQQCSFSCKFDPQAIENYSVKQAPLQPLEKGQPKRFKLIIVILFLAVIGLIICTIINYRFNNLSVFQADTANIFDLCSFIIGYIVSWLLTDRATSIFKK